MKQNQIYSQTYDQNQPYSHKSDKSCFPGHLHLLFNLHNNLEFNPQKRNLKDAKTPKDGDSKLHSSNYSACAMTLLTVEN